MADNYLSQVKDYEIDIPQGGGEPVQVGMLPNSQSPIYTIPNSTVAVIDDNDNVVSGYMVFYNDRDQDGNSIVRYGIADPQSQQIHHIANDDVVQQISQKVATMGAMSGRLVNRTIPVESQMNQLSIEIPYYKSPGEVDPKYGNVGWEQLSPDQLAAMADMTAAKFAQTLHQQLATQAYSPVFRERVLADAERQIADVRQKSYAWYQYQQLIAQIAKEKATLNGNISPQTAERVKEFAKSVGMDPSKIIHASFMQTQSSGSVDGDKSFFLPEKTWTGTYAYGGGGVVLPQYTSPTRDAVDLAAAMGSESPEALARRTAASGWGMLSLAPVVHSDYRSPAVLPLYMPRVQGPSSQTQISVQEEPPQRVGGGGGGGGGGTRRQATAKPDISFRVHAFNQGNPYLGVQLKSGDFANLGNNIGAAYGAYVATGWGAQSTEPGGRIFPDLLKYYTTDPNAQNKPVEDIFKDALHNGTHSPFVANVLKRMGWMGPDTFINALQVGLQEGATELFSNSLAALIESVTATTKWIQQLGGRIRIDDNTDFRALWNSDTNFRNAVLNRFGKNNDLAYNWAVHVMPAAYQLMRELGGRSVLSDPTRIGEAVGKNQGNIFRAMSDYLQAMNKFMMSSRTNDGRIWDMSKFKNDNTLTYAIKTAINAFADAALSTSGDKLESMILNNDTITDARTLGEQTVKNIQKLGSRLPYQPDYVAGGYKVDSNTRARTNSVIGFTSVLTGLSSATHIGNDSGYRKNSEAIRRALQQSSLGQQKNANP